LEGSKDGLLWVELDRRSNDTSLNNQGAIASFSITGGSEQDFVQIRLRQTGKNSSGYDYLMLNAIEFFGVVKSRKQ
jgi:hypothetical protein